MEKSLYSCLWHQKHNIYMVLKLQLEKIKKCSGPKRKFPNSYKDSLTSFQLKTKTVLFDICICNLRQNPASSHSFKKNYSFQQLLGRWLKSVVHATTEKCIHGSPRACFNSYAVLWTLESWLIRESRKLVQPKWKG